MIVIGVDPGTEQSAYVVFDGVKVFDYNVVSNMDLVDFCSGSIHWENPVLVLEQVESFGMSVGKEVFETVFWTGRFAQAWTPRRFDRMPRRVVKQHLCHTARATDANIRQALIDRFGPVGTKKEPGVLYGIKSHTWAALAVAVTWYDMHGHEPAEIRPGVQPEF